MSHDSREVHLDFGGEGGMRGFLALPLASGKPAPAVLVIHELLGLNDDIRRITERFASLGDVALAPGLFSLSKPRSSCVFRTFQTLARREGPALDALEAPRAWRSERSDFDARRIGVAAFFERHLS